MPLRTLYTPASILQQEQHRQTGAATSRLLVLLLLGGLGKES